MQIKKKIWIMVFGLLVFMGQTNLSYGQWDSVTGGINYGGGYVGIGTAAPGAKLDIGTWGDWSNPALRFSKSANRDIRIINDSNGFSLRNFTSGSGGIFNIRDSSDNIHFVVQEGGNVGVGISTPNAPLDVKSGNDDIAFINMGDNRMAIQTYIDGHWSDRSTYYTGENRLLLQPDSGNVGIGTTDPKHKLSVNGAIWAQDVIVELTEPADYVFADNYKLMPLSEVEKKVKEEKHLPGIPSAANIKEKGMNLGEMQNKLLEKVEELTLYMIELKKENELVKKELAELKEKK